MRWKKQGETLAQFPEYNPVNKKIAIKDNVSLIAIRFGGR